MEGLFCCGLSPRGLLSHFWVAFLTVLEAGQPEIKVLAAVVSGEISFLVHEQLPFLLESHVVEELRHLSGVSFCKATNPSPRTRTL